MGLLWPLGVSTAPRGPEAGRALGSDALVQLPVIWVTGQFFPPWQPQLPSLHDGVLETGTDPASQKHSPQGGVTTVKSNSGHGPGHAMRQDGSAQPCSASRSGSIMGCREACAPCSWGVPGDGGLGEREGGCLAPDLRPLLRGLPLVSVPPFPPRALLPRLPAQTVSDPRPAPPPLSLALPGPGQLVCG